MKIDEYLSESEEELVASNLKLEVSRYSNVKH